MGLLKRVLGIGTSETEEHPENLQDAAVSKQEAATMLRESGHEDMAARREREAEILRQLAAEMTLTDSTTGQQRG